MKYSDHWMIKMIFLTRFPTCISCFQVKNENGCSLPSWIHLWYGHPAIVLRQTLSFWAVISMIPFRANTSQVNLCLYRVSFPLCLEQCKWRASFFRFGDRMRLPSAVFWLVLDYGKSLPCTHCFTLSLKNCVLFTKFLLQLTLQGHPFWPSDNVQEEFGVNWWINNRQEFYTGYWGLCPVSNDCLLLLV